MRGWKQAVSSIGEGRFLVGLGVLEVLMALARVVLWEGEVALSGVVATDLLIIGPGVVLVYGGYWLTESDLHSEVHSVVVRRCLGGIAAMLGVVALLAVATGLNRPLFTPMAGTALGSVAGFAIGVNEARALSRATEAEHHRDELRQERDLRERIFETSPVGITIVDDDGSIRMANEHAARISGYSRAELEAVEEHDAPKFEVTDADGNPIEGGLVEDVLDSGEPIYDVERQITSRDGRRIWLSVNGAPLRNQSGDIEGVVVAFEDITERKQLEGELKETIDRLEESNERLEHFAYAASHDLQEPLRMVSSYLQLLERRYEDDLDEEAGEYIDFAVDGADRMRAMVESLLEYSRVSTRGEPLQPISAQAVLEDVLEDLQLRIDETDATVTFDDLPTVTADPNQLSQVFRNLISNAITYSGDGAPAVHVGAERIGDEWRFSVADEGIGIPPEFHDRIFDVFEQLHGEGSVESGAAGIGLALCERIVERHGGDIWVESEPGEGATFYFTLPAPEEEQSTSGTAAPGA